MIKYELIPEQLVIENTCNQDNFFVPKSVADENVLLTHDKLYYDIIWLATKDWKK